MRLTVIGGGGFRVPLIHRALADAGDDSPVDELVLYDTSPDRLAVIESVVRSMSRGRPSRPAVRCTESLNDAVSGAEFIFAAIRVGGARARVSDEEIAVARGVLGQETTGPGGLAYGMRTVPAAVAIAETVRRLAPTAYIINFTNPVGMVTEAMQRVLGERVVGICDTPTGLGRRVCDLLGIDRERASLDYVGLNHLGWLRRVLVDGEDRLPGLLADPERLASLDETAIFGADWLALLGCIPNEYLYYYYRNREAVQSMRSGKPTRAEYVARAQEKFYSGAASDPSRAFDTWRAAIEARSALYMADARHGQAPTAFADEQGYERVALDVIDAIATNRRATMVLNVRNGTTIRELPPDSIIEVPSVIDATGAHPLAIPPPDLHQGGLMHQVKMTDRLAIEAALTGAHDLAIKAFGLHPLVDSLEVARELFEAYRAAIPEFGAVFATSAALAKL
jgi:6-phospho-beta-glucosidase